ncbi:MAG: hypothetical protein UY92_C0006G0062 [Candidatus Magasanikbacteria bacterium GW2011_GWA2_56_11]|uniref:Uncharacterized protein n=1 Tax=Candidatus Magasanikbacteria bacterium GW2011_GWA2_56_11 TaxID=1619044 RepID=A0A0G1YGX8_9BACT|nr:MAG: hypothetical protein UY92_C0006G0062 [Candidatus Magasanikbacteria bacterium GW2011_GWA2_56_11]
MLSSSSFAAYIPPGFKPKFEGNLATGAVSVSEIAGVCHDLYFTRGLELKTITATDERNRGGGFRIFYVFGVPKQNLFIIPYIVLADTAEFPSLTKDIHEASSYERRIMTFFGLSPAGHPHPRPLILHENWPADVFPLRQDFNWQERPAAARGNYEFYRVEGEGIYEIPVGPVHAGIIEPGHFRFSVAGEEIMLLEAKLGYKHKGIEKLFENLPLASTLRLAERISGDTSFTHALAFCQAIEQLTELPVPRRAAYLRVIFSELERLANHANDIGFIMLDTGYSFGGSQGARLREVIMRWNERLTGSRFLRGVNVFGGVAKDITPEAGNELEAALQAWQRDFDQVIAIAEDSHSLLNRLEDTGKLDYQLAVDHGIVGVAGRAVGLKKDARLDYPYAAYAELPLEIAVEKDGDVRSRFYVRVKEARSSVALILAALKNLPRGECSVGEQRVKLARNRCAVGLAEGWRGEIVYFVMTGDTGDLARVDVRDPSFVNWAVLGHAGRGNVVPDFPLINKSFNLSYSGNDL